MTAAAILQLVMTYGPNIVEFIDDIVKKLEAGQEVTVADVEAEFVGLKPYSAYSIKLAGSSTSTS